MRLILRRGCGAWLAVGTLVSPSLPHLAKGFVFMEHSGKGCPSWSLVLWVGEGSGGSQEPRLPVPPTKEGPVTKRGMTLPCPSPHFTCSWALIQLLALT